MEDRQTDLETRQSNLEAGQARLEMGLNEVRATLVEHGRRLRRVEVLQEEVRDQVKQVAEGHGAVIAAINQNGQSLREMIDRRIAPLEQALRQNDFPSDWNGSTLRRRRQRGQQARLQAPLRFA